MAIPLPTNQAFNYSGMPDALEAGVINFLNQLKVAAQGLGATITATGALPATAFGSVTPYNSASAGVLTLPPASDAWNDVPYGLVIVSQKGAGAASFAAGGADTLQATSGITTSSVQYGMIAAQVISATEWALA